MHVWRFVAEPSGLSDFAIQGGSTVFYVRFCCAKLGDNMRAVFQVMDTDSVVVTCGPALSLSAGQPSTG